MMKLNVDEYPGLIRAILVALAESRDLAGRAPPFAATQTPSRGMAESSEGGDRITKALERAIPMRRLGQPDDVAPEIAFLASDEALHHGADAVGERRAHDELKRRRSDHPFHGGTAMASTAPTNTGKAPPRWILKAMTRTHVFLHRLSGGRFFNKLAGDDVCFVTMTGAKSGRTLTIPLMYVPYQNGVLLVASVGGSPKNPVWFGNLVKYPDIEVEHRGKRMSLRARQARADEKPALWPICDQHYAPYADYRKRTTRDIPIFVCEPR